MNILYTMFWENENYWHWTHDGEVLKALIPALGYMFVGVVTWLGIWRTSKIAKQTLEDTREGTPPELLRLEKWSTIIKDSKYYLENIEYELDVNTIKSTYNDVLKRATLENRVMNLGILSEKVIKDLVIIKPKTGNENYPQPIQGGYRSTRGKIFIILNVLLYIFATVFYSVSMLFNGMPQGWLVLICGLIGLFFIVKFIKEEYREARESNIVFRNGYHALRDVYLARESIKLIENSKERMEREEFEKSRNYKRWKNKIKREHPKWESWNYGLDIGCNNKPEVSGDIKTSKIRSIVLWRKSLFQNFLRKALRGKNSNPSSDA